MYQKEKCTECSFLLTFLLERRRIYQKVDVVTTSITLWYYKPVATFKMPRMAVNNVPLSLLFGLLLHAVTMYSIST